MTTGCEARTRHAAPRSKVKMNSDAIQMTKSPLIRFDCTVVDCDTVLNKIANRRSTQNHCLSLNGGSEVGPKNSGFSVSECS